jgi:uncharacterized hydrophobic protein (TIGR00271 family)
MARFHLTLARLFNLRRDQDDPEMIDETIRSGVTVSGTNLWVLIFAIFIASIGLNVNSPAVIIGAMLISPLMGPIVGIGYGAGVKDLDLIRLSFRNLGIFIAISLSTATLYFLLTPLTDAQSELLARTSPNLWDVLIAFFGGAVGMIAATRRYSSNVVPGVAIATALMPPLCTAGYGIANGNLQFFGGAFYLFTINSVFIALSSLTIVKLLRLPRRGNIDGAARKKARWLITGIVLATAIPSGFLAVDLVRQKLFEQQARQVLRGLIEDPQVIVLAQEIDPAQRALTLTLGGEAQVAAVRSQIEQRFQVLGVSDVRIQLRAMGSEKFDIGQIKETLQKEVLSNTWQELQHSLQRNRELEAEIQQLRTSRADHTQLAREIAAQYPEARQISVGQGIALVQGKSDKKASLQISLQLPQGMPQAQKARLQSWLETRQPLHQVVLHVSSSPSKGPHNLRKVNPVPASCPDQPPPRQPIQSNETGS